MKFYPLAFVFFVLACTKPSTTEKVATDATVVLPDTTVAIKQQSSPQGISVGYFKFLEETNEFYVTLYYRSGVNDIAYSIADSVVYEDDGGYIRKRIPMNKAREYFFLDGLDTIRVYTADPYFLATARLARVEYIEDAISAQYAAVYKFNRVGSDGPGPYYAVSAFAKDAFNEKLHTQIVSDTTFNARVLNNLKLDTRVAWTMTHRRIADSITYSSVNEGNEAYIIETTNAGSIIMSTMTDGYHFGDIIPVPIYVSGKPLLLGTFYNPEGDDSGEYLMAFNGKEYEGVKDGVVRIKL